MKLNKTQWTLAAALGAATVVLVSWRAGREDLEATRGAESLVGAQEQISSELPQEAAPVVELAENTDNGPPSPDEMPDTSGVRRLFSEPDYGSNAYREASAIASEFLRTYPTSVSRNKIVKADPVAIRELVAQLDAVESMHEQLDLAFDVSAFSDVPCVMSSIRYWGGLVPLTSDAKRDNYMVAAFCDESPRTSVHVGVRKDQNSVLVSVISQDWGTFTMRPLGGWDYFLAYRHDDIQPVPPPIPGARVLGR